MAGVALEGNETYRIAAGSPSIRTEKFHTGYFSLSLLRPLDRADASKNALLMNVLRRGSRSLPDMEKLQEALNDAYGAGVEPMIRQFGEALAIGFCAWFPDDRCLPEDAGNLERVLEILGELLLDPATRGGLLQADYVNSERRNLKDRIDAMVNDKQSYASFRARQTLFAGERYAEYPLGTAEAAEKITNVALTKHYKKVLATSPIELFYCGSAEPERVEAAALNALRTLPGGGERLWPATVPASAAVEMQRFTEHMDVNQGKLVMLYPLDLEPAVEDYSAMVVFNAMFGGSPASRLFREVREKRSLCYSASSGIDRYKGVLSVHAGIAFDKAEEVEEAVNEELRRLAEGQFTPEELETARYYVASAYRRVGDSGADLDGFLLGRDMLGLDCSLEQFALSLEEVTAEQVVRIAESARLRLVYFLRKEEEE